MPTFNSNAIESCLRTYATILRRKPRFFCINDDMGDAPARHPLLLSLVAFLRLYFPGRSAVERGRWTREDAGMELVPDPPLSMSHRKEQ